MAVRSKRLWGPTTIGTAHVVLYTCPAAETALLKTLSVVNLAALGNTWNIKLNGTSGANTIMAGSVAAGEGLLLVELFIVLQPGDVLRAIAGSASIGVTGFGAELEGVAD